MKIERESLRLGAQLRAARLNAGLTQIETARQAHITIWHQSLMERGWRSPSLKVARRLSAVLDTTIEALFYGTKR